jgi:hypothetical protein
VFEHRVLRIMFGPKRKEVTRRWRNRHNEELNDLYYSPNIVRVIKSRRMRWTGPVTRTRERKGLYRVWWGNLREGAHLEDPDVDGIIILRRIVRKWDVVALAGSSWLRIGTGGGYL